MTVDLDATVYAFDATTIVLCLSVYPWAPFRSTKGDIVLLSRNQTQYLCKRKVRVQCTPFGRGHDAGCGDALAPMKKTVGAVPKLRA